jgi:hypothetical protein
VTEQPDVHPADPREEGVEEKTPRAMQIEPAHLLANDVRAQLRERGFSDEQIDEWADTFIAEFGSGDATQFLAWIEEQEQTP